MITTNSFYKENNENDVERSQDSDFFDLVFVSADRLLKLANSPK